MGTMDISKFSKEFSLRTEKNYDYLYNKVCMNEIVLCENENFLHAYSEAIKEVDDLITSLREDANEIKNSKGKGPNNVRKTLYSIATKIDNNKNILKNRIKEIAANIKPLEEDKLFEVTQLLNSLLGIAVLPYEMHKEYFVSNVDDDDIAEENKGKNINNLQKDLYEDEDYVRLKNRLLELYESGKWDTTYKYDKIEERLKEKTVVFRFLKHLRNAVCHGGNSGLGLLPLSEGVVIDTILLYEQNKDNEKEEFAMRISVEELVDLVKKIAAFYRNTKIGEINTTSKINRVIERVDKLLPKNENNKRTSERKH